ncbi:HAD hydrolase family protein [bacterium]|nr:HAD hydrolase family protein [bacterium]
MEEILRRIRMILMDVDGVLTDGRFYYLENDLEAKAFDVKDGFAIRLAGKSGMKFGIITGKMTPIVEKRAKELEIEEVHQGYFDKVEVYKGIKERTGFFDAEFAYIGDDLFDMGVMKRVGFAACPADAVDDIKAISDYVCKSEGGRGCVREVIEMVLKARGQWENLIKEFIRW